MDTFLDGPEGISNEGAEVLLDPQDHYLANPRSTVVLLAR